MEMREIVGVGKAGSRQHSGQTSGAREGTNSGRPCAIFLRKMSLENMKNSSCLEKISERKLKRTSLSVEGMKVGKTKTRQFSNTKLIEVRVSC